jgi:uncharacterized protein YegL
MSINEFDEFFEDSSPNDSNVNPFNPDIPDNPEPRCPVILILDTSGSMEGEPIKELNAGIETFKQEIIKNEVAKNRVEVAIITFGGETPKLVHNFVTVKDFNPFTLRADGRTPMGGAINLALEQLQQRKDWYKQMGLRYYRPWLFLISDGVPTDNWSDIPQKIQRATDNQKLIFYAVGVNKADMNILRQIAPNHSYKLQGLDFQELFLWLSSSMVTVSESKIGELDDSLPHINFQE